MAELRSIEIGPGLVLDVLIAGPADGQLVLLLHGFSESLHMWHAQLAALAGAGYRALAPSQRGYSPGARPNPADTASYQFEQLVADVIALRGAAGRRDGARRFHLVGHDWGGSIAWGVADRHPDRLASLTVLSRPHPNAFNRAMAMADNDQAQRSRHHQEFLRPEAGPLLLANGARRLRDRLAGSGVPAEAIERHIGIIGNPAAMEAALAWYRARGAVRTPLGTIGVPVLYIWGDADDTVGRAAAEGTGEFVSAPYRFEVLPGIGHFAAEQAPERVSELLLAHLAQNRA